MRYVVLLRGINVGGHNKLPMAELRKVLEDSGFNKIETYIQSGNIALDSDKKPTAASIGDLIEKQFALKIPIVVRTKKQIEESIQNNPFTGFEPKKLHVLYLDKKVKDSETIKLDESAYVPDKFKIIGNHVYVFYSKDSWSSKVTIDLFEKTFNLTATARNWNTALRLRNMVTN